MPANGLGRACPRRKPVAGMARSYDSAGCTREAWAVVDAGLKRTPGDPALKQLQAQWAGEGR